MTQRADRNDCPYRNPALSPDARAADLLERMTLAEKIAQLQCMPRSEDLPQRIDANGIGSLASHWESIAACDFFTVEAWTPKGLTRFLVLFVIDLASRKVEIAGIHPAPAEPQMTQWARQLTDAEEGFLKDKRVLIHDRDPLFTKKFRRTLSAAGVRCLRMPKQSPNLNAYAESWVRSIKRECLSKMVLFGRRHVRHVVDEY
ncbi:MAG: DDE-type integrase/transposase/recombinase, partial [Phycisphaerae bacterium]|nr:DDE-type integrase/transposase/recombinase [Phycisphaerae bacterium]